MFIICCDATYRFIDREISMTNKVTPAHLQALRDSATHACTLLKNMANEDRLLILCQLSQGERNVGEIETATGIQQPTLSQQLTKLRDESLVSTRREGKYIYYAIASDAVIQIMHLLYGLFCGAKEQAQHDQTSLVSAQKSLNPETLASESER